MKRIRARKANFSMLEESILQREVENNVDVTNLEKARIWKNVTSKINALGVAPRSVKEIKDKWSHRKLKIEQHKHRTDMNSDAPYESAVRTSLIPFHG